MRYTPILTALGLACAIQASAQQTFTGKPEYIIETRRADSLLGMIRVELFPNIAPKHVSNFDSLVGFGFYDTTAFHRVIPGFVIQGGDPNSRHGPKSTWGYGDPNQPTVDAEFSTVKHVRGILSAARKADPNSATSQFFICVATAAHLDGNYSVHGRVLEGMDVVDLIVNAPRDANDCPIDKIEMFVTFDLENQDVPLPSTLVKPDSGATGVPALVTFDWLPVTDGFEYTLEIAWDPAFTNIFRSVKVANDFQAIGGIPQANDTLYWRVWANNGGKFSVSNTWNFVTDMSTSAPAVAKGVSKPAMLVYPNPAADRLMVRFTRDMGESDAAIFDPAGKLAGKVNAVHEGKGWMELDISGLAPGRYTLVIGGFSSDFVKLY